MEIPTYGEPDKVTIYLVQDETFPDTVKILDKQQTFLLGYVHEFDLRDLFGNEAYNAIYSEEYGSSKAKIELKVSAYPL